MTKESAKPITKTSTKKKPRKTRSKKVHLTIPQIKERINVLAEKLKTLEGPSNKKKRANTFGKISRLKRAMENPSECLADVETKTMIMAKDKLKRVSKKLAKKQARLLELRSSKNRTRKLNCLICKRRGHRMKDCPQLGDHQKVGNICYNCGDGGHGLDDCSKPRGDTLPYASCFICKEIGHLSRDCSQNKNGIFPKGGGCHFCGSNRHKKVDCPDRKKRLEQERMKKDGAEFDFKKE